MSDPTRKRIQEIGRLAALTANSLGGADAVLEPDEVPRYNLLDAIQRALAGQWPYSGTLEGQAHRRLCERLGEPASKMAIRVPREILTRDATASGGGAALVDDARIPSFYGALHARSVVFSLGATRLDDLVGHVALARLTSEATASWQSAESVSFVESTPGAGFVLMSPKTVGAYIELPDLALKQIAPAGQAQIFADAGTKLGVEMDAAALGGSGLSGQPLGIANIPGVGSSSGISFGYSGAVAAQQGPADANGIISTDATGYVTTPSVAGLLMQRARFSNTDTPLWNGSVVDAVLAGARATSTKNCPAGTMIFGDWSQLVIGFWGGLTIEVNPFANFRAGITGVRALLSCDIAVRWRESFHVISNIT